MPHRHGRYRKTEEEEEDEDIVHIEQLSVASIVGCALIGLCLLAILILSAIYLPKILKKVDNDDSECPPSLPTDAGLPKNGGKNPVPEWPVVATLPFGGSVTVDHEQVMQAAPAQARWPANRVFEPAVEIHPTNKNIVVGVTSPLDNAQYTCPSESPGYPCNFAPVPNNFMALSLSTDGGVTWGPRYYLTDPRGSSFGGGDPVITAGPRPSANGKFLPGAGVRWYYSCIHDIPGTHFVASPIVYYSDVDAPASAADWSGPHYAFGQDPPASQQSGIFDDKPWMEVDKSPSSPFYGHVYMVSSAYSGFSNNADVSFSSSRDGGRTWAKQTPLYMVPIGPTNADPQVTCGPDGTIYVLFTDARANKLVLLRSADGGKKWESPVYMTDVNIPIVPSPTVWPGTIARAYELPGGRVVVDQTSNKLHIVVRENTLFDNHLESQLVLYLSGDNGDTFTKSVLVDNSTHSAIWPTLDVANGTMMSSYYLMPNVPFDTIPGDADVSHYNFVTVCDTNGAVPACTTPTQVSSAKSDPNVSLRRRVNQGFSGDYNHIALSPDGSTGIVIYADARNGVACDEFVKYIAAPKLFDAPDLTMGDCDDPNFSRIEVWTTRIRVQ